ncbi:hypothetical protein BDZ97DRAFT_1914615 [Flammula alnicola]|nr:hypothetical protein BDZ97DRAFT_1914615 [Flammula alnicola]
MYAQALKSSSGSDREWDIDHIDRERDREPLADTLEPQALQSLPVTPISHTIPEGDSDTVTQTERLLLANQGADTVLLSPSNERRTLQNAYNVIDDPSLRKVYVEYTPFIQRCIREREFHHCPDITGMSGVPAGRRRIEYTAEDDERLCQYLSRILPDKKSGGRQGLKVYQALLEAANQMPEEYSWAK